MTVRTTSAAIALMEEFWKRAGIAPHFEIEEAQTAG
jgi:hypothetical protein